MPWTMILSVPGHHGEAADPELLVWIKQLLDQVLGSADWVVVAIVGLALVACPIGLVLFYLAQMRRDRSDAYQATDDGA
ncbi:MAG: hypothetical protein IH870_08300 [Chloroflexi bacterium]|nr:hypothetical protein [Chloroflexota bacterium]